MHNIKEIRENPDAFDAAMKRRGLDNIAAELLQLDKEGRNDKTKLQALQEDSNSFAREIGHLKSMGENADEYIAKSKAVKAEIAALKKAMESGENLALTNRLAELPNIMDADVPDGNDETNNQEIRKWGEPTKHSFTAKTHEEIGTALGQMNFEQTAKISGSRFVTLSGDLAQLERALGNFFLDLYTNEFGYEETSPPLLVKDPAMYGTSQLPKFAEDCFTTDNGYRLISTSEISLTNLVRETILDQSQLPLRYVAHTPCFRSEAGSAGKDTKGMIRQHQFWKVELVSIVDQESSDAEHERLVKCAEEGLKRLGLSYRVMLLCSGDTGFGAKKTYDLEVWMAGQNTYREVSSCSNCGDFQARRMDAKYRDKDNNKFFAHTLNGTGGALGRLIVAILEQYQQENGTVAIPEILQPYMGGKTLIERKQ